MEQSNNIDLETIRVELLLSCEHGINSLSDKFQSLKKDIQKLSAPEFEILIKYKDLLKKLTIRNGKV